MRHLLVRLLPFLIVGSLCAQTQAQYDEHIQRFEGYRAQPYVLNNRAHVGYGHLIMGDPARYRNLSHDQLLRIYQIDFSQAYLAALTEVPSFYSHPTEVRVLIVGLSFNLGRRGLRDFTRFRAALARRDYLSAARELCNSRWARQVGRNRSQSYIQTLTSAAFVIPSMP